MFVGTNITVNKKEGVTDVNKEWEEYVKNPENTRKFVQTG